MRIDLKIHCLKRTSHILLRLLFLSKEHSHFSSFQLSCSVYLPGFFTLYFCDNIYGILNDDCIFSASLVLGFFLYYVYFNHVTDKLFFDAAFFFTIINIFQTGNKTLDSKKFDVISYRNLISTVFFYLVLFCSSFCFDFYFVSFRVFFF